MTGNLRRIEKTAQALAEELVDLGDRLNDTYERYMQALAPAVQQQLVLAVYHLCTQGYPERFLALSIADRAAVQIEIQQLARDARESFERYFDEDDAGLEESELSVVAAVPLDSPSPLDPPLDPEPPNRPESSDRPDAAAPSSERAQDLLDERPDEPSDELLDEPSDTIDADDSMVADNPAELAGYASLDRRELLALALQAKLQAQMQEEEDEDISTPGNLLMWQRAVESDIVKMLHDISLEVNQFLQKRNVLPQEFPSRLFEAIGQGGDTAEALSGTPNVLQLTIEAGDAEDDAKMLVRLLAIDLRLSEIEFADAEVSQPRHAIRKLLAELSGLRKRYAANQREYTIAQAEVAWRSTWSEQRGDS